MNHWVKKKISNDKWHKRYIKAMTDAGVDEELAKQALDAGMGYYDYDSSPEDSAYEEMGYWGDT